jgi:hypothetical protein
MKMDNQQTQRLIYDGECKDCNRKSMCDFTDTTQCCSRIIDKLRYELGKNRNSRKPRKIIAKISITTEYIFNSYNKTKTIADKGMFVLKEPYIFGEPFLRAEITGKGNSGTFSTKYYGWNK